MTYPIVERLLRTVISAADRMCRQSAVGSESEEHWSDRYAEADDLLSDLQTEAKAMIEAATGVSWDQLSEALL